MAASPHPVPRPAPGPIRPTVARIDLEALRHNAREAHRVLAESAGARGAAPPRLLAVVKADAYGHGAVPVARTLEALGETAGIGWLGVALVEEGIALREAGIRLPILVLGGPYDGAGYPALLAHDLTPVVWREDHLAGVAAAARAAGRTGPVPVHLKLDTGMGRIGALPGELDALLEAAKATPEVRIDGVLSHFANADLADDDETSAQIERFRGGVGRIRAAGFSPRFVHLANSAALLDDRGPDEMQSLVRPGLMLYGYPPAPGLAARADLRPVLSWVTRIAHLKRVPPGFKVSYGQTWTAERETLVATLPLGYADGYDRRHGNGSPVLVGGRRCEIIGRVCMDMCMTDVTDVPGVALGDEVVLIGRQGEESIGADTLAERIGTISYEILCAIGERVPRVA